MTQPTRDMRRRISRSRHRLERLEARLLCSITPNPALICPIAASDPEQDTLIVSASTMSLMTDLQLISTVVSTEPMSRDGQIISTTTITLTFDRPINPDFLFNDIQLERADLGGALPSAFELDPLPSESLDASGTRLIVILNQVLPPGSYQVFLSPNSILMGQHDFAMLGPEAFDGPIAAFEIRPPGLGLGDAIDLGQPGHVPTARAGVLDLQAHPTDVELYKVVLPAGHFWRLGVEVSAQRDGSALDSALTLFDAQGRPIVVKESGRSDFPGDPYIFAGLAPGTYYIGVSGRGNLPGSPGGYDISTGAAGWGARAQAGGSFTLRMIADPADRPITLRSFAIDRADPLDPTPTGLTLGFSGSIRLDRGDTSLSASLSQGIEVVDQSGHVWPVAAVGYSEADARISFLFLDRLPEGRYTVRLPQQGALVDLAGLVPTAPGQPARVLGTFSVGPVRATTDPYDLGALTLNDAIAGISRDLLLNPGESVTYRVVITSPGLYSLRASSSGGPLSVLVRRALGLGQLAPSLTDETLWDLKPGVYYIRLTNEAPRSAPVHLELELPSFSPDSLLESGIGLGPALNLALIAPPLSTPEPPGPVVEPPGPVVEPPGPVVEPPGPVVEPPGPVVEPPGPIGGQPNPSEQPSGGIPTPSPSTGGVPPSSVTTTTTFATSPPGVLAIVPGDFVGRPSLAGDHISAVGPGGLALASNLGGLPRGISFQGLSRSLPPGRTGRASLDIDRSGLNSAAPQNGAMIGGPQLSEPSADEPAGSEADWPADAEAAIARLTGNLVDRGGPERTGALPEAPLPESARVEQAGLTSPVSAGLMAALLIHLHRPQLRRWLLRKRGRPSPRRLISHFMPGRRPHTRV